MAAGLLSRLSGQADALATMIKGLAALAHKDKAQHGMFRAHPKPEDSGKGGRKGGYKQGRLNPCEHCGFRSGHGKGVCFLLEPEQAPES